MMAISLHLDPSSLMALAPLPFYPIGLNCSRVTTGWSPSHHFPIETSLEPIAPRPGLQASPPVASGRVVGCARGWRVAAPARCLYLQWTRLASRRLRADTSRAPRAPLAAGSLVAPRAPTAPSPH